MQRLFWRLRVSFFVTLQISSLQSAAAGYHVTYTYTYDNAGNITRRYNRISCRRDCKNHINIVSGKTWHEGALGVAVVCVERITLILLE